MMLLARDESDGVATRRAAMRMCEVVSLSRPLMAGASCGALMIWSSCSSESARMPLGRGLSEGAGCWAAAAAAPRRRAVSARAIGSRGIGALCWGGQPGFDTWCEVNVPVRALPRSCGSRNCLGPATQTKGGTRMTRMRRILTDFILERALSPSRTRARHTDIGRKTPMTLAHAQDVLGLAAVSGTEEVQYFGQRSALAGPEEAVGG